MADAARAVYQGRLATDHSQDIALGASFDAGPASDAPRDVNVRMLSARAFRTQAGVLGGRQCGSLPATVASQVTRNREHQDEPEREVDQLVHEAAGLGNRIAP
jgi:hypothetical protein